LTDVARALHYLLRACKRSGMKTYLGAIGDDVDLIIEIEAKKKS
jgi:hypothetical protein